MTYLGYILVGWLSTVGIIAGFAWTTLTRGRRLSRRVPPEDRRWA